MTPECGNDDSSVSDDQEKVAENQDDKSCDDNYSDDTISVYYIASTASMVTDDCYTQPPVPPPRTLRAAKLRRDETLSEADACVASGSTYKSLRSQSDPSTHYTTVVKPKAIRPLPINLDRLDYRNSLESLHTSRASAAFVQYRDCSAFRQHTHCILSSGDGINLPFPHPFEPARNYSGSAPRGSETPPLPPRTINWSTNPRASSLTDISKRQDIQLLRAETSSQCSSSPKEKLSKLDVATDPLVAASADSSECSESKSYRIPWDLFWTASPTVHRRPLSAHQADAGEPIHMTLEEVRSSLQTLHPQNVVSDGNDESPSSEKRSPCRQFFRIYFRSRKSRKGDRSPRSSKDATEKSYRRSFPSSLKSAIAGWFKLKKAVSADDTTFCQSQTKQECSGEETKKPSPNTSPFTNRALPPLPRDGPTCSVHMWEPSINVREESSSIGSSSDSDNDSNHNKTLRKIDYAASIEKVKDCGWYWGPISGEMAENLLSREPDGSFVVRDSSDEHYIFSLTFKLNGLVRHVRIEHDHGNFSFGCLQKFRSNTIVDFIENAVEHSRSGRYLFFLHRRPILGPMRVQLLHPVSRFKQVQSLQHLCRFVILKAVRRDLIEQLPLPRRLMDYLNTPHYYSEELEQLSHQSSRTEDHQAT